MKKCLQALVFFACLQSVAQAQVKDVVIGVADNALQVTNFSVNVSTNFDFGGVGGTIQVEAVGGKHGITAKTSDIDDGAAFYGWSESGAPAMKLVQSNNFTSPALTVWRPAGDDSVTPTVLIAGSSSTGLNKAFAIENQNGGGTVFWVNYDGSYPKHYTQAEVGSTAIDWKTAETFYKTLGGSTIFTFSNAANGQVIIVVVENPSTYTVTWPSGVRWSGGTEPTQTVNGTDLYTFTKVNNIIYGSVSPDMK